jgi:hypothetical protein
VKKMYQVEMIEFLDLTDCYRRCIRWRWSNWFVWQIGKEDAPGVEMIELLCLRDWQRRCMRCVEIIKTLIDSPGVR